jgi:uncharacterized protein YecE (DUF72 family)
MRIWLGTAGYAYREWIGPVYSPRTTAARMLAAYARLFPLVEINNTFYRCPTPEQFGPLLTLVPAGFRFSIKLPQTITHEGKRDDLRRFCAAIDVLAEHDQLAGVLAQFPESFQRELPQRRWLTTLIDELALYPLAIEFRHRSWAAPAVTKWLAERAVDLVSVDVPDLPQLFPPGLVRSSARLYLRLHSRVAANWYADDAQRYNYDYPDDVLIEWIMRLRAQNSRCTTARVLFNNCAGIQAVTNARRFQALAQQMAPELEFIAPFAPAPARQLSLFGDD